VAPTAVFGDALLDPATGDAVRDAVVLIENDHVTASGARSKIQVPSDARRVDAEGLWLLPGLIDCHVHLCMTGTTYDLGERLSRPASLTILQSVDGCAKDLAAGFTSVRDAGGTPNGVRMAVERGYFPGPRMKLAISILSETGGHADSMFPCGVAVPLINSPDIPASVVDGIEPMRLRVREIIRAGADWIKLCTSGGVLSPGDAPHHPAFTVEEIRAAVEEAAAHGRTWENSYALDADAERRFISDCVESIIKATGQRPIGWNAYWMRNSPRTLDILQRLGFLYHIDEPSRDEPFIVTLKGGDFVSVPYTFHLNDIVSFPFVGWSAAAYEQALRDSGATVESHYYEGGLHGVSVHGDFQDDAFKRSIDFYRRYLK